MKLIITQPEIEAIVRAHVENTVQLREGADMKIDFTATRSEDGITATIDIPYLGVAGIPEIAAAVDAKPAATAPAPAPKAAAKPRGVLKGNAGSLLLGAGSAGPATEAAANPEPVKDGVAETVAAGDDAQTAADADAAPFDPADAAVEPAAEEAAPAAAPASSRGPSLFGS